MSDRHESLVTRIRRFPARLGERLAEIGSGIAAVVERPFAWLGRGVLNASERVDSVDSIFSRFGRLLAWPFVALWRLLVRIGEILLPESVRHFLASPFRLAASLAEKMGRGIWAGVEALNLDGLVRWLAWLTKPVWRPLAGLGGFLITWMATRNYKQLLWGVPALILAGPLLVAFGWRLARGNEGVAAMYRIASKQALEAKDFPLAQLYDRKLADLGVDTKITDFRSAIALADEGKEQEAYERMLRLAPLEAPTFPAAHIWIVQQLFSGKLEIPQDKAHELAGKHLDAVEKLGVTTPDVQFFRALWLTGAGKPDEAAKILKPLVLKIPEAALASMQIHLERKDVAAARADAQALHDHIMRARRAGEELSTTQCHWWAMAEELLGNEVELKNALDAWLQREPDEPQARLAMSEVYRRQFERLVVSAAPPVERLQKLLCDAARHPASRAWAELQIANIMRSRKAAPVAAELAEKLQSSSDTPPVLIEAMGTWHALQNDPKAALPLLKRALHEDPSNAIAWNNYAWALNETPATRSEALDAVNEALKRNPGEFRFLETRGQIYAKLGKWPEAIEDLEVALNGMPNEPAIHSTLASAYDATGDKELAEVHRRQAQ